MNPRETVQRYVDRNWRIVVWPQIGDNKGPREKDWQLKPYTLADYRDGYRVGILTGVEVPPGSGKFLHDVDIDWGEGYPIAHRLLPDTNFIFGRPSKTRSHFFYTLPEAVPTFKYEDIDGTSLIELRGTKKDGELGFQTMVPPSIWTKEGKREPLEFVQGRDGDPIHLETSVVKQRVCLIAIGMILARHLGVNGFRATFTKGETIDFLTVGVPLADVTHTDLEECDFATWPPKSRLADWMVR